MGGTGSARGVPAVSLPTPPPSRSPARGSVLRQRGRESGQHDETYNLVSQQSHFELGLKNI